jgi:hypothetical protein
MEEGHGVVAVADGQETELLAFNRSDRSWVLDPLNSRASVAMRLGKRRTHLWVGSTRHIRLVSWWVRMHEAFHETRAESTYLR